MLVFTVYLAILLLLLMVALRTAEAASAADMPPALTSCVLIAGGLYVSCLIPGVLGLLYPPITYGFLIALSAVALWLLPRATSVIAPHAVAIRSDSAPITWPDRCVITLGVVAALPLLTFLRWNFPSSLLDPDTRLGWDTVSYHLPGFLEFSQNHSLWSLDGPFQSYSFAFELIGNFFSQLFFTHWGLMVAHGFAIMLLAVAVTVAARALTPLLPDTRVASWLPAAVLTFGLWSTIHTESLKDVGKNDVFMTACLFAALCFLLELIKPHAPHAARERSLVVLLSTALGLAIATKPSALAYLPFFALAAPLAVVLRADDKRPRTRQALATCATVLFISFLFGGFWLVRNLLAFGHLTPLTEGWNLSLVANLENPALYEPKRGSVLFGLALVAIGPGLYFLARCRRDRRAVLAWAFVVAFHVVACAAFAITPHAIFHQSLDASIWKLRLGMPLFISASLILGLFATHVSSVVSRLPKRGQVALASSLILAPMALLPIHWRTGQSPGLPGYESIKSLPPTEIYNWVDRQPSPLRIYSAGLRPYGLYGPSWENRLFYDLHAVALSPLGTGQIRIAAIVVQLEPDLIMISVDPHFYTGEAKKPAVVDWMRAQSDLFEEVFSDVAVSAFEIKEGAADHLRDRVPPDFELRMGG